VLAESTWGVNVAERVGTASWGEDTGVKVGRDETFVREFCACTVCATAVEMSFCACEAFPHEAEITAKHRNSDMVLNFCKIFYILSWGSLIIPFQKTPDHEVGRSICIKAMRSEAGSILPNPGRMNRLPGRPRRTRYFFPQGSSSLHQLISKCHRMSLTMNQGM